MEIGLNIKLLRNRNKFSQEEVSKNLNLYRIMLSDYKEINLPEAIKNLSTKRLLTMTKISGIKVSQFIKETKDIELKNKLALNMFKAWYVPFYKYGVIHGDPHLGNYTIEENANLNLLDFGCIRIFQPHFVSGVIDLYVALRDGDKELAVSAYKRWGFKNPTKKLIEVLNIWATFVYQPLLDLGSHLCSVLCHQNNFLFQGQFL